MELAAKLTEAEAKHAEAHANLINTEFGKLKLELKDSNEKWLLGWIHFLVLFCCFWSALCSRLKPKMDQLDRDGVEKSLDRISGSC